MCKEMVERKQPDESGQSLSDKISLKSFGHSRGKDNMGGR